MSKPHQYGSGCVYFNIYIYMYYLYLYLHVYYEYIKTLKGKRGENDKDILNHAINMSVLFFPSVSLR